MDSVYVVNNYLQSGDSGIFKDILYFIPLILTAALVYFAWRMKGLTEASSRNAEAILKNAASMKALEETNLKIAVWPEIKEMIDETHRFVYDVALSNVEEDFDCIDRYINKMRFMRYYILNDDELYKSIISLINDGRDIKSYFFEHEQTSNKIRKNELNTILTKERGRILQTIITIDKMFEVKYGLEIPSENHE